MSDAVAGKVLDAFGTFVSTLAPLVGGATGAGMAGAGSIAKALGTALGARRESVSTILAKFVAPPDVHLAWSPDELLDTMPQTPSAKELAAKKDGA